MLPVANWIALSDMYAYFGLQVTKTKNLSFLVADKKKICVYDKVLNDAQNLLNFTSHKSENPWFGLLIMTKQWMPQAINTNA